MKIRFIPLLVVLGIGLLISCNKNNQVSKQLDGTWRVDRIFTDQGGVDQSDLPREVSFTKCKADKENCPGEWIAADGSSFSFVYTINSKGEEFIWGDDQSGSSSTDQAFSDMSTYSGIWQIEEHSKSTFIITSSSCNGCTGEFKIEMSK